jgi:hypothetical protein
MLDFMYPFWTELELDSVLFAVGLNLACILPFLVVITCNCLQILFQLHLTVSSLTIRCVLLIVTAHLQSVSGSEY